MLNYTLRRSLQAIPLLIFISIMMFTILHYMPGGPLAAYMQNPHITAADIARLKHNFGLDRPLRSSIFDWFGNYAARRSGLVAMNSTPASRTPSRSACRRRSSSWGSRPIVSLLVGLTFGILAAVKPYSHLRLLCDDVRVLRIVDADLLVRD